MIFSRVVPVQDASQVAVARRTAVEVARSLKFTEGDAGKAAIVATEAATNVEKHSRGGYIIVQPLVRDDACGLEILALDKGPGIQHPDKALADGYSTAGTPGTGLGAIARLSSNFDLYSDSTAGTALLAQLWRIAPAMEPAKRTWAAICTPMEGEQESGDGWSVTGDGRRVMVCDGLGHGPGAAEASDRAIEIFNKYANESSASELLELIHEALKSTRGAAAAIAELDAEEGKFHFVGIGNISATLVAGDRVTHGISHNGTLGRDLHKIGLFTYALPANSLLILHSDGIATRWDLAAYPGLATRHPALIAGVLYRDFARPRDDRTIVVIKIP